MPASFSEGWGGATVCILVSFIFIGCIAMQACSYFSKFQKDPLVLKCAVSVILLGCFLQFALDCWAVHSYTISQYDVPPHGITTPFWFPISAGLETVMHSTAQGAYIFRVYRFGYNRYLLACSCTLVLLELGFGFTWVWRGAVTGATEVQLDALGQEIEWDITSFFVISAFVDVFITISITYQLMQSRSSGLKRTKHLIDGIIRLTIPTGMLTSFVAIVIVFLWNLDKGTFNWVGACILEPCCYATGLLALLNARKSYFDVTDSGQPSMSLPMTTFSAASRPAGASPSSGTAAVATIPMAHHFPSTSPRKEVQTTEQAESQDQVIYNLKSSFPVSS